MGSVPWTRFVFRPTARRSHPRECFPLPRLSRGTGLGGGRPRRRGRRARRRREFASPAPGEVAASGLRDDQGNPRLDEREVESPSRVPGGPGRLLPPAQLGEKYGQSDGGSRHSTGWGPRRRGAAGRSPRPADPWPRPARGPTPSRSRSSSGPRASPDPERRRGPPPSGRAHPEEVRPSLQPRGCRPGRWARAGSSRTEARRARVGRAALPPAARGRCGTRAIPRSRSASAPGRRRRGGPTGIGRPGRPPRPCAQDDGGHNGRIGARDAVVGHRRMRDVLGPAPGHVAVDATVVDLTGATVGLGETAAFGLVAGEAAHAR